MRPYGTVSPLFWIGKTGKKLRTDRDGQVIALYLMTNPHSHQTGIYHLPMLYLSSEVGIPIEGALEALQRLETDGFCRYDESNEWIWVCEMAAWQIGEALKDNDKRAVGVRQYLDALPKLPFIAGFVSRYQADFHIVQKRALEAPSKGVKAEAPSKGVTLIRSEQEQNRIRAGGEHEGNHGADAPPSKLVRPGGERKASRIPDDFALTPERRAVATAERIDPDRTFAKFRDYWRAKSGSQATKLDWDATWRNWCRSEGDRNPQSKGGADNGLPFAN